MIVCLNIYYIEYIILYVNISHEENMNSDILYMNI